MTLDSLLQWTTVAIFVVLAALTLVQWSRSREHARFDIALVFASLAVVLLLQGIVGAARLQAAWLTPLTLTVLVAHPYLLLRLVDYFRPVSSMIWTISRVGTALSLGMIWLFHSFEGLFAAAGIAYFCWLEGYVTVAFGRCAWSTGGVAHWRYLHAAGGAGLLTSAFALGILNVLLPQTMDTTMPLLRVLVALAGLSFYFGFAPPQWLRQIWQYWELHRLARATPDAVRQTDLDAILSGLCDAAMRAVGGQGAAFVAWNEPADHLEVRFGCGEIPAPGTALTDGAVTRAWETRTAQIAARSSDVGLEAWFVAQHDDRQALYALPVVTPERAWGVLTVFLRRVSLFAADNVDLLTAFCAHIAISLDYAALLRRQRALIEVLDTRSSDLQLTNAELSREIQNRVKAEERLEGANRELEAFSYSVSHDLQAPLRHISGFASLLQQSPAAAALDATGKRHLAIIIESVGRMGKLIDDLLGFSRAGRVEMHATRVSLDRMIQEVRTEVSAERKPDELAWTVHPLPEVDADPALLRQVFVNLLSNAVKYTRTRLPAEVAIGAIDNPDEVVIFVRDNGVGFDMAYADKLFDVFQRLHRLDEFEGTGVGLANVKRVIVRHGGRVWAEGAVDRGATFYVALPKRNS